MSELLVVEDLKKHFPVTRGIIFQREVARVRAVDGVSFTIRKGETIAWCREDGKPWRNTACTWRWRR